MEPTPAVLPSGVVTFLLTDIEDSTRLWEEHPADMAPALERHDAVIDEVVSAHDGTVLKAKGEGDATLSVFRRASDAARAAHALATALDAESWPGRLTVRVRLALHTGEAHERDGDYFGPTLNRAARIRGKAAGGQVLLSDVTAGVVRERLPEGAVLTDLGEHELRGLARAERIWALSNVREAPTRPGPPEDRVEVEAGGSIVVPPLPAALVPATATFVGREAERAALADAWKQASASGTTRLVLLGGEPGVGKTRLASEIASAAHEQGALVLFGRSDENLGVAYQPWAEALRSLVGACPTALLERHVTRHGGELGRLVPDLTDRLPRAPAPSSSEPEEARPRLFDAVTSLLVEMSQLAPILLVTDDLHWADQPTLLLLRHLTRAEAPLRLLVVGTYRDTDLGRAHPLADVLADLRREAAVVRVSVGGLSRGEVEEYLQTVAGHELPPDGVELAAALHRETSGNPFFVGEVVRHLVDRGVLYEADGQWTSDLAVEDLGLPEGVREVVSRRLSRLSEGANQALRVAALLGQSFTLRLLEAVPDATVGPGDDVLDVLEEAVAAGLLQETTGGFVFSHALVRQTLASELSGARRTRLHRRIGEAIESLPDVGQHIEELAHHFGEAALDGQLDKATGYALQAAQRAIQRAAYEEAEAHIERGLSLLDLEGDPDLARRTELYLAQSKVELASVRAEGRVDTRSAALAALRSARESGRADLLAAAASVYAGGGILGAGAQAKVAACEEALRALGPDGDLAWRSRVVAALARTRSWDGGEGPAVDHLASEAVELARGSGDQYALVDALGCRVFVLLGAADLDCLAEVIEERIHLAERVGDPFARAVTIGRRGEVAMRRGDRDGFESALAGAQMNYPMRSAIMANLPRMLDGHFDKAVAVVESAPALFSTNGEAQVLVALREQGRVAEFYPLLRDLATANTGISGLRAGVASWESELGLVEEARARLLELVASLTDVARDATFASALGYLIDAAVACGETDAARILRDELLPWAGQLMLSPAMTSNGAVDRFLGMAEGLLGDHEAAEAHFAAALSLEEGARAPVLAARTLLWWGRARIAAGDEPGARPLLERAHTMATDLGMALVAADAAALL